MRRLSTTALALPVSEPGPVSRRGPGVSRRGQTLSEGKIQRVKRADMVLSAMVRDQRAVPAVKTRGAR